MSALEEAQISLNEAALRWLDLYQCEKMPTAGEASRAVRGLAKAAETFRHLAEARGPAPVQAGAEFPPRPDTSQQGIEWSGPVWPPEYDYSRGDTWNGRAYPQPPVPGRVVWPDIS